MNSQINLNRALRRTFWQSYDNLGLLTIATIFWLLLSLTVVLLPAATVLLFYLAKEITKDITLRVKDFFNFSPKRILNSYAVFLTLFSITILLPVNLNFYLRNLHLAGLVLAGIYFWIFILVGFYSLYTLPLLSRDKSYKDIFKYSFLIALGNIKSTFYLWILTFIFLFIEIIIPIFGMGLLAVFLQNIFLEFEKLNDPSTEIEEPKRNIKELWENFLQG